jgi:hypothetical protein
VPVGVGAESAEKHDSRLPFSDIVALRDRRDPFSDFIDNISITALDNGGQSGHSPLSKFRLVQILRTGDDHKPHDLRKDVILS